MSVSVVVYDFYIFSTVASYRIHTRSALKLLAKIAGTTIPEVGTTCARRITV